jgi:hypothetical protein
MTADIVERLQSLADWLAGFEDSFPTTAAKADDAAAGVAEIAALRAQVAELQAKLAEATEWRESLHHLLRGLVGPREALSAALVEQIRAALTPSDARPPQEDTP